MNEMIEIIDKINNTCKKVADDIDMVIHPLNRETVSLKDLYLENQKITGVIFKEDGSTLILYKNIWKRRWLRKWMKKKKLLEK